MSSVRRSVQVMDLLSRKSPLGVRAIASQVEIPVGSAHRILLDLESEGIVERTPARDWELSYRLLKITGLQLERIELPTLARPFAERIAAATGETVNLNARSGLASITIDKVRGNEGMQLDMRIGTRGTLYCGGAGKAILAYLSEDDQQRVLDAPTPALTPMTLTDPATIREELGRIRERGYAIDNQEVVMGVYCVSVPILDRTGRAAGAISIAGPSPKQPGPEIAPLVAMLAEACDFISRRLGYTGDWSPVESPPPKKQQGGTRAKARTEA